MKTKPFRFYLSLLLVMSVLVAAAANAANTPTYDLKITKDGLKPDTLAIPAQKQVRIMVENASKLPAEIESNDITLEKVIPGNTTLPVYVGPLKSGEYKLFNDFAQNATGRLIVK